MKIDQHERHDVDADTHALKVVYMPIAGVASQSRAVHGDRKITAILDTAIAFVHTLTAVTDTEEWMHAHSPREAEPDCTVVWILLKARSGAKGVSCMIAAEVHSQ